MNSKTWPRIPFLINYKLIAILILFHLSNPLVANDKSKGSKDQSLFTLPANAYEIDKLNDQIDKILIWSITIENYLRAETLALSAAEKAETINYKIGMQRSYEQLIIIYKNLKNTSKYKRYKKRASAIDKSELLIEQKDKLKAQKAEAKKLRAELAILENSQNRSADLIQKKQLDIIQKEEILSSISEKMNKLTLETERLTSKNKILQKDKKIIELENNRQKAFMYFLSIFLFIVLFFASILFKLFKTKNNLAKELKEKNELISVEKKRSDDLLLNILPLETANELKLYGKAMARHHETVSVLFTDFVDFTLISEKLTPIELVAEIDMCYCAFDDIIGKYGIEKIKTIGDAYLCAQGIEYNSNKNQIHNPAKIIDAALEIINFMEKWFLIRQKEGKPFFKIRIGINSGPVVAGVVGRKKFAYDIWGDTVNTAARMEQNSEEGKINISSNTYKLVKSTYNVTSRGKIEAKNKGHIDMYFINNKKS